MTAPAIVVVSATQQIAKQTAGGGGGVFPNNVTAGNWILAFAWDFQVNPLNIGPFADTRSTEYQQAGGASDSLTNGVHAVIGKVKTSGACTMNVGNGALAICAIELSGVLDIPGQLPLEYGGAMTAIKAATNAPWTLTTAAAQILCPDTLIFTGSIDQLNTEAFTAAFNGASMTQICGPTDTAFDDSYVWTYTQSGAGSFSASITDTGTGSNNTGAMVCVAVKGIANGGKLATDDYSRMPKPPLGLRARGFV